MILLSLDISNNLVSSNLIKIFDTPSDELLVFNKEPLGKDGNSASVVLFIFFAQHNKPYIGSNVISELFNIQSTVILGFPDKAVQFCKEGSKDMASSIPNLLT